MAHISCRVWLIPEGEGERTAPQNPSSIVKVISSRVIILVLWHVGAHPQVINPTLSLTTEFSKIQDQQVWIPPLENLTAFTKWNSCVWYYFMILWYLWYYYFINYFTFIFVKCYITFKLLFLFVKENIYIKILNTVERETFSLALI